MSTKVDLRCSIVLISVKKCMYKTFKRRMNPYFILVIRRFVRIFFFFLGRYHVYTNIYHTINEFYDVSVRMFFTVDMTRDGRCTSNGACKFDPNYWRFFLFFRSQTLLSMSHRSHARHPSIVCSFGR